MAVAAGVAVAAGIIGVCLSQGRILLTYSIAVSIICGELFNLGLTAERLIDIREAKQAVARANRIEHGIANQRVARLEASLLAPPSAKRLAAAMEAKTAIDETIAAKAAERNCASNCRQLLDAQRETAVAEVAASQAAVDAERADVKKRLKAARASLEALPPQRSDTPLADRLGWAPWVLDLTIAALGAIAANGLAACLIAFGAHAPAARSVAGPSAVRGHSMRTVPALAAPTTVSDREHVSQFLMSTIEPDPDGAVSERLLADQYSTFVAATGGPAIPADRFAQQLRAIATVIGLEAETVDGDCLLRGARMKAS
jgi:hypothetical protein